MNKKLWLSKRENACWQNLWKTLLAHRVIEPETLKKSWRDVSTPQNCWMNLSYRWLKGEFGITRKVIVERFIATFGDVAECNTKLLEWGRVAEELKKDQIGLN